MLRWRAFQVLPFKVLLVSICIQVFKDIVPSRIPSHQVPISAKHQRKVRKEMITTTSYACESQSVYGTMVANGNVTVTH